MNVYFCILNPVKMRKIEHIGIAVHDLENSNELFSKLFGQPAYKTEEVASEGVKTSFFMCGPNKIELLEATDDHSAIAKFIERNGEGIHHIAFDVDDIDNSQLMMQMMPMVHETMALESKHKKELEQLQKNALQQGAWVELENKYGQ